MSDAFLTLPTGTSRFLGYKSEPGNASPEYLSSPSQNCLVTEDGRAAQRLGYQSEFSVGTDGSPATAFYHAALDVAVFALDDDMFVRDFTTRATSEVFLTATAGTTTRFAEFFGDVYFTNSTDGIQRLVMGRLNGAASAGAGTVTVDRDMAARLSVFGVTTGTLWIADQDGVLYGNAFNAVNASTGVITLTGTLAVNFPDNSLCWLVHDINSGREKASKILFWKSRMHLMGFLATTNADQPNNTVVAGQFVIGQTGATGIENIIDFTYGTGGSTKITVSGGGRVTNMLGVGESIWFFTQEKVFSTHFSEINAETPSASSPGSALGLTIPKEKDPLHGCINEDCATVMGNDAVTYVTEDRRFMRIRIDTDTGAAVSHPEEDFDVDVRGHLKNMDKDQTGALVFHYRGGRQTIYQVRITGQWYWFIFDHNIIRTVGSSFVRGAWQPPQQITPVRSLFERNGVLYGTDPSDDTVYSFFTTFTDNLTPIYCVIATGEFNVGNAMMGRAHLKGEINQPSQINIRCHVTNESGGRRSGSAKVINGSDYTYTEDNSVGAVPVGDGGVEAEATLTAKWSKEFGIFPSQATRAQLICENQQDGGFFSLSSFQLTGKQYPRSFSRSL